MKYLKWIIITSLILNILWYAVDSFRNRNDYFVKKIIGDINGETIVLHEIKIEPDASYMPLEVKITETTKITALGFKSLFINNIEDLKQGQKVRVWYGGNANNEKIAVKVVVYSF
ncbi:hypothetical protein IM538_13490 [Cytobacillus suaedae]|nr:hypothetical protein IM538_13490 [Cytobacillus suaedae]